MKRIITGLGGKCRCIECADAFLMAQVKGLGGATTGSMETVTRANGSVLLARTIEDRKKVVMVTEGRVERVISYDDIGGWKDWRGRLVG